MVALPSEASETPSELSVIWLLSGCNFVIGMGAFVLVGLVNPISDSLALTPSRVGALLTTYAIAYAILSPLLVSVTGHVGRRLLIAFGMGVFALANLGSALAWSEGALHLSRILAAAGAGVVTPITAAVAAALSPPEIRGRALATVLVGLTLAQVVGVPAGGFVGYVLGWRVAFGLVAVLALPMALAVLLLVPAGLAVTPVTLADLGRVLRNPRVMLAVLYSTTFLGAIFVVYTYLGPLLAQSMGWGRQGITLALAMYGLGAVAGNIAGGRVTDAIGPYRTLAGLAALQVALMPVFSLLPMPGAVLVCALLFWSLFGWSFGAAQQVRLIALWPEAPGVVLALNAAAIFVGSALGSAVGGAVLAGWGTQALGLTGGIGAALALGHILLSRRLSGA